MKIALMDELFLHELKDLYDAEHQLVDALPKLADAATDPDLRTAFERHLKETRTQVTRLKAVFQELGEEPERETCDGMKGLVKEGEKVMDDLEEGPVLDAGLIAAAQKVEHYEIATYGTLITWAELAEQRSIVQLLGQSLEEERAADEKLTEIATVTVNSEAEGQADGEPDDEEEPSESARSRRARNS